MSTISDDESRNIFSTHFVMMYVLVLKSIGSMCGTGLLLMHFMKNKTKYSLISPLNQYHKLSTYINSIKQI